MAETAEQLVVSLEARIRDFERNFQRASRASNDNWRIIEARASQGAQKLDTTFAQATRNVSNHFKLMATSAAGALSAALGVSELRKFADEWTAARSKIAAAGEEMENVGKRQSDLTDMANRSRSSIGAVVDLYTGLTRSTKEMGASQAQVLRVTENISKAFATSGASTEEAKGAITQLNQALASGALRGDELNSVMEQAPTLARLIAKEFGVTIGELKKLGEDGKLSADRVFKAILNGTAQIEEEFAKTTPTMAQGWQILTNETTRYVGKMDEATGASKAVSGALKGMADNIDVVAPLAFSLAAGLTAAFAGGPIVGGITAATVALAGFSNQLKPISGDLASLVDYSRAAWDMVKEQGGQAADYLAQKFVEAAQLIADAMSGIGGMDTLLAGVKTVANGIIGAFTFAGKSIAISLAAIGPMVAETIVATVNSTLSNIEKLINGTIAIINRLKEAIGSVGDIAQISMGRVTSRVQGSSAEAGRLISEAAKKSFNTDYIGEIGQGLQQLREKANAEAQKRLDASKTKPHDDGSLDQTLKSTTPTDDAASKKAQKQLEAYDKIVAKAKEFIETQEIEREAMTMDAQSASALKHEHEMLNKAKEHGIELTDKQKDQIHDLANQMAAAETATKNFQDMQASLKEFGDTISGELTSALEGLVTGSTKLEDVWKRLALLFAKMALEAVLLGKGPLAGLFGVQGGGLLGGTPFGGSLGDAFAKLWGVQSIAQGGTASQTMAPAIQATTATPAASASATTPAAVSAVTPKITEAVQSIARTAAEKATANVPTPPSRPSDLTPSAPLPPRRPGDLTPNVPTPPRRPADLASDGLPAPVPPANIPHVGSLNGLAPDQLRAALMQNVMRDFGLSKNQAAGLVGNLSMETGGFKHMQELKPLIPGSKGGYGMAQWTGVRRREFEAFAREQGKPTNDLDMQYGFLKKELGGQTKNAWTGQGLAGLKGVNSPEEAALYVRRYFERPAAGYEHDKARLEHTRTSLRNYEARKPGVDMTPTGSIAKQGQDAAKKAAEQASQAQQRLSEQLAKSSQAAQQIAQPLSGMDSGVTKLAGSLTQGVPAADSFAGELEKLIQQLLSGLGGGGGGLGGIGEALGGILGFAAGGSVKGPGGPTSDSIPAFLSNGEFVIRADAAKKHGALLAMINEGKVPRLALGGSVGIGSIASTYSPTVNISGMQDAHRIAAKVGEAIAANAPDTFRRSKEQQMAEAFRAMSRSHIRNG